jgi:hypothetical protein
MADQQPLQPPQNPHAGEEEQQETAVDRMTDVDRLLPPIVGDAPPHFHSQRQAKRARQEESLAADSQPPSPPELYRDALHTVYGWLTFKELVTTSRINKSWYAAACNLKSRGERLDDVTNDVIYQMVQSPLRRHVTQLISDPGEDTCLTVASLLLLKTFMPHVEQICCGVIVAEDTTPQLALPVGLRFIRITFRVKTNLPTPAVDEMLIRLVASIARGCPRLTSCQFGVKLAASPAVWSTMNGRIVEPLSRMSSLTDLALYGGPHPACIDLLRRMTQLRRITTVMSAEQLDQLTAEPHQFALESLQDIDEINPATIAALIRLPTLTELTPRCWRVNDPGTLLAHLPHLTKLHVCGIRRVDINRCMVALARLTNLESLTLSHPELTSAHLCTLLPHLTRLSQLELWGCTALSSLACLSLTHHLASTLQKLSVSMCHSIPPFELHHLRALTALRKLTVWNSFTAVLDASTIAEFTPGSLTFQSHHFPHLAEFYYSVYEPPSDEEEDEDGDDDQDEDEDEDEVDEAA